MFCKISERSMPEYRRAALRKFAWRFQPLLFSQGWGIVQLQRYGCVHALRPDLFVMTNFHSVSELLRRAKSARPLRDWSGARPLAFDETFHIVCSRAVRRNDQIAFEMMQRV